MDNSAHIRRDFAPSLRFEVFTILLFCSLSPVLHELRAIFAQKLDMIFMSTADNPISGMSKGLKEIWTTFCQFAADRKSLMNNYKRLSLHQGFFQEPTVRFCQDLIQCRH